MIRKKIFDRIDQFNDWADENMLKIQSIIVTYEDGEEERLDATRSD